MVADVAGRPPPLPPTETNVGIDDARGLVTLRMRIDWRYSAESQMQGHFSAAEARLLAARLVTMADALEGKK